MNIKSPWHLLSCCLLVIFLTACGSSVNAPSHDTEPEKENPADEQQENRSKDENNEPETGPAPDQEEQTTSPAYEVTENWFVKPTDEESNEQVVLLTIDDAPDEHALEMAETLDRLDVPAIFFVNGHFIEDEEGKKMLQQIDELGFPIGNHTMTHPDLTTLSKEEQKEEISELNEIIKETTGKQPQFFRAPFGKNTDDTLEIAKEEQMLVMNWSYGYDWEAEYQESDALSDIMVNTPLLDDGAILLMHDREWTNDALADIVTGLQDKGYEMLDPSEIEHPHP